MVVWVFIAIVLGDLARIDPHGTKGFLCLASLMMAIVYAVMMVRSRAAGSGGQEQRA
jgi:hypothetical protein